MRFNPMNIIAVVILIWCLLMTWFVFVDGRLVRKPIEFFGVIQTEKSIYHVGELVQGRARFCKNRNVPAEFQWIVIGGKLDWYPDRTSNLPVGCHDLLIPIEVILPNQPKGATHFETLLSYKVNFFNTVHVPIETNIFQVK